MYITAVPNRSSPPAILLRESYRDGDAVRTRTLANLSSLSPRQIEGMRRALKDEPTEAAGAGFEKVRDRSHGAVAAIEQAMRKLGLASLLDRRRSRERELVLAMVAARIAFPQSKLATSRAWPTTTVAEDFGVQDADEDELYEAMDWLLARQDAVEKKLARRHLHHGGHVLYDLSSSYFEGRTCPLAKLGYSRDGKRGKLQVTYGLLTDGRGCPVSIRVYEGNRADATTLVEQAERVQTEFGIDEVVLVGDRGMIGHRQIAQLRTREGIAWVTALKTGAIRTLEASGTLQLGLFDERNLVSFEDARYPGERLIACKNHDLARKRAHTRASLIEATRQQLAKVARACESGRLRGQAAIGVRVGKVVGTYKVAKHFEVQITETGFTYRVRDERVAQEAALDGIYVIRTSVPRTTLSDEQAVHAYKDLAQVERAFRSLKTVDLHIRPIHHRTEARVRAHLFLCMLAYYVEWHLRQAWAPLLFADDEPQVHRWQRDPVAPAPRAPSAVAKCRTKRLPDGTPAHSFRTLLGDLASITKSTLRPKGGGEHAPTFTLTTTPTAAQQRAFDLLAAMRV